MGKLLIGLGLINIALGGLNVYRYLDADVNDASSNYELVKEAHDSFQYGNFENYSQKMDYVQRILTNIDSTSSDANDIFEVKKDMVEYLRLEKYSASEKLKEQVYTNINAQLEELIQEPDENKPSKWIIAMNLSIGFGVLGSEYFMRRQ